MISALSPPGEGMEGGEELPERDERQQCPLLGVLPTLSQVGNAERGKNGHSSGEVHVKRSVGKTFGSTKNNGASPQNFLSSDLHGRVLDPINPHLQYDYLTKFPEAASSQT